MIFCILLAAILAQTQSVVGDCLGTLRVGQVELRLALHVMQDGNGLTATLDSLDQGTDGIPITSIAFKDSKLTLSLDVIAGSYEGILSADFSSIDGVWFQSGRMLPLKFARAAPAAERR